MSTEEKSTEAAMQSDLVVTNSEDLGQGYTLEVTDSGWSTVTRLVGPDGRKTAWADYKSPMLLGDKVCLSPYWTEKDVFILIDGIEALAYLCTGVEA